MINLRLLRDELLKIDDNKAVLVMSNTTNAEDENYDITYDAVAYDMDKWELYLTIAPEYVLEYTYENYLNFNKNKQEFDSIKISDLLALIKRFSVSNINIIWNFTDPKDEWYNEIMTWFEVWDNGDESITLFFY